MCFEETCLPLCLRANHLNDPYCEETGQGLYASSAGRGSRGERLAPVCSAGDRYVAGGADNLMSWFLGLFGFECKTDLQRAQDCVHYLRSTTGKDHYIDTQSATGGGDASYYYAVLEGKR